MSRYHQWAKTIFCWDGVLPLVIAQVAVFANLIAPNDGTTSTLVALVFIIGAFFLRCWVGNRMYSNRRYKFWQPGLFFLAILILIFLDALLIVFRMHPGAIQLKDWEQWGMMYGVYLLVMAGATFPLHVD